jgi:hypothetical protein
MLVLPRSDDHLLAGCGRGGHHGHRIGSPDRIAVPVHRLGADGGRLRLADSLRCACGLRQGRAARTSAAGQEEVPAQAWYGRPRPKGAAEGFLSFTT